MPVSESLPRPVCARVKSLPPGSRKQRHAHSWAQLSFALSGVLAVRTAFGSYLAPPQRAIWIPPGIEHEVLNTVQTEMRNLFIDPVAAEFPARCRVLEISPLVRELIRSVSSLPPDYVQDGPAGRLVQVLLDQLALLPEVRFSLPLPVNERLAEACAALQRHPDDHRTAAQIAQDSGMSERTMARLFARETGLSFRDWRARLRLLFALSALEEGKSVTAVSLECGYESTSAFIVAFKKHFGKTPGGFCAHPPAEGNVHVL